MYKILVYISIFELLLIVCLVMLLRKQHHYYKSVINSLLKSKNIFEDTGRLASTFIHDLISPIAVCKLYADELKDTKKLLVLKSNIDRVYKYVLGYRQDILNKKSDKVVMLDNEINYITSFYSNECDSYKIRLETTLLCLGIKGREVYIHRVFQNLLDNSISAFRHKKHGNDNWIRICMSKEENKVIITYEDNAGTTKYSDSYLNFIPFKNSHSLNLGSFIVKELVETELNGKLLYQLGKGGIRVRMLFDITP